MDLLSELSEVVAASLGQLVSLVDRLGDGHRAGDDLVGVAQGV